MTKPDKINWILPKLTPLDRFIHTIMVVWIIAGCTVLAGAAYLVLHFGLGWW